MIPARGSRISCRGAKLRSVANKRERHDTILEIVGSRVVSSQEDLRKLLRDCVDLGVSETDLWAAYTRILRLSDELDLDESA